MKMAQIISQLKACEASIRAEGVEHLSVFGSRARSSSTASSDIDILVELTPGTRFSLLNLSGVGLIIEDATGLPSQVVLQRSAPPQFLARIADDIVPVF
jgi:uncharacterized protein